jgi:hypothetical protein
MGLLSRGRVARTTATVVGIAGCVLTMPDRAGLGAGRAVVAFCLGFWAAPLVPAGFRWLLAPLTGRPPGGFPELRLARSFRVMQIPAWGALILLLALLRTDDRLILGPDIVAGLEAVLMACLVVCSVLAYLPELSWLALAPVRPMVTEHRYPRLPGDWPRRSWLRSGPVLAVLGLAEAAVWLLAGLLPRLNGDQGWRLFGQGMLLVAVTALLRQGRLPGLWWLLRHHRLVALTRRYRNRAGNPFLAARYLLSGDADPASALATYRQASQAGILDARQEGPAVAAVAARLLLTGTLEERAEGIHLATRSYLTAGTVGTRTSMVLAFLRQGRTEPARRMRSRLRYTLTALSDADRATLAACDALLAADAARRGDAIRLINQAQARYEHDPVVASAHRELTAIPDAPQPDILTAGPNT